MTSKPRDKAAPSLEAAAAMTVNERLYAAGLLDDFDAAVAARDKARLHALLVTVQVGEPDIAAILRTVLRRPRKR